MITNGEIRCHRSFKCLNMFFLDVAMGCIGGSVDESNFTQILGRELESQKPCKGQSHILSFCNLGSMGRQEVEQVTHWKPVNQQQRKKFILSKQGGRQGLKLRSPSIDVLHSWTYLHTPEHTCMGVAALLGP